MDENKSTGMEECEIRHKHRSAKEEKDLISRLNRIEGQVRGVKAMVRMSGTAPISWSRYLRSSRR